MMKSFLKGFLPVLLVGGTALTFYPHSELRPHVLETIGTWRGSLGEDPGMLIVLLLVCLVALISVAVNFYF